MYFYAHFLQLHMKQGKVIEKISKIFIMNMENLMPSHTTLLMVNQFCNMNLSLPSHIPIQLGPTLIKIVANTGEVPT